MRAFNEIKQLSAHHNVTVIANIFEKTELAAANELKKYCDDVWTVKRSKFSAYISAAISMLGGKSASEGFFAPQKLLRLINQKSKNNKFDFALGFCSSIFKALDGVDVTYGKVMDMVDADSAKWLAYAQAGGIFKKAIYHLESQRIEQLEQKSLENFSAIAVTAQSEADIINYGHNWDHIHVIANGVDSEFFSSCEPSGEPVLIFTGTMNYQPNIDAVCWFAEYVWPEILKRNPAARFIIAGRKPDEQVKKLGFVHGITVTGEVDDIRTELSKASIAIAPLKIARGVQNKILEAMAARLAVVCTPEAVAGIDALNGRECICAIDTEQWINSITSLLFDARLRKKLTDQAHKLIEETYSWPGRLSTLVEIFDLIKKDSEQSNNAATNETDRKATTRN